MDTMQVKKPLIEPCPICGKDNPGEIVLIPYQDHPENDGFYKVALAFHVKCIQLQIVGYDDNPRFIAMHVPLLTNESAKDLRNE